MGKEDENFLFKRGMVNFEKYPYYNILSTQLKNEIQIKITTIIIIYHLKKPFFRKYH